MQAEYYPETLTETVLEWGGAPKAVTATAGADANQDFLERLWAYLTIKDLLIKVARGEYNSCDYSQQSSKRKKRYLNYQQDDEDYSYDYGSGLEEDEEDYDDSELMDKVLDEVGDADIVICDNLEKALFLSLKYEFVTPLTSLVVVSPSKDDVRGDFGEIQPGKTQPADIRFRSHGTGVAAAGNCGLIVLILILMTSLQYN